MCDINISEEVDTSLRCVINVSKEVDTLLRCVHEMNISKEVDTLLRCVCVCQINIAKGVDTTETMAPCCTQRCVTGRVKNTTVDPQMCCRSGHHINHVAVEIDSVNQWIRAAVEDYRMNTG